MNPGRLLARHGESLPYLLPALLFLAIGGLAPVLLGMRDLATTSGEALEAIQAPLLWGRLGTSLLLCLYTLALMIPLGLLQAWFLARTNLPFRHLLLVLAPIPFFLPPLVHVLTWFRLIPLQGMGAIVLVSLISFQPLVLLMALRGMDQTGRDELDALVLQGGRRLVFLHDMRQALPSALIGGALAVVFMLSDFAVADFLTSIGPKVTVYADTLYAHHLGGRGGAVAAAALPGFIVCMLLLAWALRRRRSLGETVGAHFVPPSPLSLGAWRYPFLVLVAATLLPGSLVPLVSLGWQVGSMDILVEQFHLAQPRLVFTLSIAAGGATLMALVAIPLGLLARRIRVPWLLDVLVFLPFAMPALLFGIGLTRTWNQPLLDSVYTSGWVVLIAVAARYLAFVYLPFSGSVERLDACHEEGAVLEGAGVMRRFLTVILPMTWRTLAAGWCIAFCLTLRELDTLVMLRAGQQSLTFHLYSNVVFAREDQVAAIALLLLLVTIAPIIVFLFISGRKPRLL